ncbi:S8 family serine peptidase [Fredinandcohnia sp. 179-A 10B2 NHS]|uniref:S8 family serine peptidase n=1 Tax=Fredinandcohnia sp. 179-A 10B2 NHS TaxID=3235176 RepID=UPI0039A3E165
MKKTLALVLAFLMLFANTAMAAAGPLNKPARDKNVTVKESFSQEEAEKFALDEKVRVIVEVEGAPAIEYATKQGKKFTELSESKQVELQNKALSAQKDVKTLLSSKRVKMEFKESFTTTFNGFSGVVEYGKIATIEKLDGVSSVTIANEYKLPETKPEMKYSKELIEAQNAWNDYGYKGEGMIVGIIDSGIDPTHKDMVLTDESTAALSKDEVDAFIAENNLPGKYYSAKVPYGYNYMDGNAEVRDLGPGASFHGMHVGGTVAANGDETAGGIKGVAPEAQLLALKVFGNDPEMGSTWGDIYIKAIDDSIILGADVINMSLGSTASFVNENDPEQQAIANAVDNGVLMSISAGNSAHFGNGFYNPYASNPDVGVVGAPGLSTDSLQVASLDNSFMDLDGAQAVYNGVEAGLHPFLSASSVHPNSVAQKTFEVVYAGLGIKPGDVTPDSANYQKYKDHDDFAGLDLTGKYALIQRGEIAFVLKAQNAQAAGAAGVIIFNNADGYVNMQTDAGITIPQLFMLKQNGDELKAQLDAGVMVELSFNGDVTTAPNPTAGKMSDFTSWGVTPNLDFKPEITAPGGNIYSTFNDDQYGVMSGTSMAAPHVSGGSALVLQRVKEDFAELTGQEKVEFAKNLLMNTASPVKDKGTVNSGAAGSFGPLLQGWDNPYSPRRQGAGLMQLHAALSTPVVVTEATSGIGKVALKEVGDQFSFTLEATNYSDETVTYDVAANVQTDFALLGELGYFTADELESQEIRGAVVTLNDGNTVVEVPANGTATINVQVDLTNAEVIDYGATGFTTTPVENVFPNGYFVEGFVTLTDSSDVNPELSVPYVGFKGDWNAAPVLDALAYDDAEGYSFYEYAAMLYQAKDEKFYYLGHNPFATEDDYYGRTLDRIAISPNGDGEQDNILPLLSFLRNAKEVKYNVLDEEGNVLRTIRSEQNVRKNYYDGGLGAMYSIKTASAWDGKVKNKVVADGTYYYEIASTIDYAGKDAQSVKVAVVVDTVAPTIEATRDGDTVTINAADDRSGLSYVEVVVNGESQGLVTPDTTELDVTGLSNNEVITLVATDIAGNSSEVVLDTEAPSISVTTPETFSVINTRTVEVKGTVTDKDEVTSLTVEGKEVELVWNAEKKHYAFETTVTFDKDGAHPIHIVATDASGNETSLSNSRLVFVDTTAPVLTVDVPSTVASNVETVDLKATLSDNAEELRYFVDGSEEFFQELPGYDLKPFTKNVTTTLTLEPGENTFSLELYDVAGNKTTKEVTVFRGDVDPEPVVKNGWEFENGKWFYYTNDVKKTGWLWDSSYKSWFFFNKDGSMATGWVLDGGKWYHLKSNGKMTTGWYYDTSYKSWYFLNNSGVMATGWVYTGGKWYYLYSNGKMAYNTTIGGYKLGSDGAWIK